MTTSHQGTPPEVRSPLAVIDQLQCEVEAAQALTHTLLTEGFTASTHRALHDCLAAINAETSIVRVEITHPEHRVFFAVGIVASREGKSLDACLTPPFATPEAAWSARKLIEGGRHE